MNERLRIGESTPIPDIVLEEFARTSERILQRARAENRLIDNPSTEELRRLTAREPGIKETMYGSFIAESEPNSRAAMFTKNSVDHSFGLEELELLAQCERILFGERLIQLDRIVGNRDSGVTVRLIVPERFTHVAYGGGNLFIPPEGKVESPTYLILMFTDESFETNRLKPLPQKDITIRLAMLPDGKVIKIIRNSNYIGEYKKGVFAAEDWIAKTKRGGIFLHAGCREDCLQSFSGEPRLSRSLIIALSANGKTTLTSKILARKGREKSWLVQDDGGTLMRDGSFYGYELGGIFAKTEGINPEEQREIYYGLLKQDTFLENVRLAEDGDFDFYDTEKTANGRAVIRRRDFMHTSRYIGVEKIDNIILISRGPLLPAISKLNLEQAVTLMILGQAMESSAGDPTQAGKIRSEFFYDPFMAGDKADHTNRFYEILKGLPHLNFYLLNTGGIGEGEHYKDVSVSKTIAILNSLLRGGLDEHWIDSPGGFKIPTAVRDVDDIFFHPEKLYLMSEFEEKMRKLNQVRREALEKIGRLPPGISI
ncbi:hypothetical protein COT03_01860 [Candidatus Shapirobacteria bacterium CG07_land_8_20_14_0_80_39_18]|uniref:phosphoenolpyruvate carboxykinase (ATP) n=1 Tax=Candidatus Shapirobacteria bacterium CG07_land_8_20_14_0_80_39_18 TaxID=1974882 RepID=A0A2M6YRA2_9BACT|nr:MAG: hypothetical protein COT03_01860 [Candidatus Shapirobacteria bacterium CG07_land_8_20_14_0_80_39_18]